MPDPSPAPKAPFPSGVAAIDQQHIDLLGSIQELRKAMRERHGAEAVGRTLGFLVRYTDEHFVFEEAYMKRLGYPGLEAHHQEHLFFRAKVQDLAQRATNSDGSVALELATLLYSWFQDHILTEDVAYAEFARQRRRA